MKNILTIAFAAIITCLVSCGKKENTAMNNNPNKVLVAYFSATGTTKAVAERIAKVKDADLFEITPAHPYTDADLDWRDSTSRSTIEMKDSLSRPEIANRIENFESYGVIYVGFPIWWYTCPTIINTFMEQYDFTGKTVIPFATSGGSTIDKAAYQLQKQYPAATWKRGLLLNDVKDDELEQLLK